MRVWWRSEERDRPGWGGRGGVGCVRVEVSAQRRSRGWFILTLGVAGRAESAWRWTFATPWTYVTVAWDRDRDSRVWWERGVKVGVSAASTLKVLWWAPRDSAAGSRRVPGSKRFRPYWLEGYRACSSELRWPATVLFGPKRLQRSLLVEGGVFDVEFPEGSYPVAAKVEKTWWGRKRLPAWTYRSFLRASADPVRVEGETNGGIPTGRVKYGVRDGVFGVTWGVAGPQSVAEAIERLRGDVMEERAKNGFYVPVSRLDWEDAARVEEGNA